jgi:hypothetical protein
MKESHVPFIKIHQQLFSVGRSLAESEFYKEIEHYFSFHFHLALSRFPLDFFCVLSRWSEVRAREPDSATERRDNRDSLRDLDLLTFFI